VIDASAAMLWLGVVAVGAYHGLNPAMGWPLAVAGNSSISPCIASDRP